MEPSFLKKAVPVDSVPQGTPSFASRAQPVEQPVQNPVDFVSREDARLANLPAWQNPLGQNVAAGFSKGAISTVKGIGTLGQKFGNLFLPKSKETGIPFFNPESPEAQAAQQSLKPQGFAQGAGNIAEKVIETAMPLGKAGSVGEGLNVLDKSIKGAKVLQAAEGASPLARAGYGLARTGLRAAGEALPQYGIGYVQSGANPEAAKAQALTAGVVKVGTGALGEVLQGTNSTLRPYIKLFGKNNIDVAKEARTRGLTGSTEQIQDTVAQGLLDSEQQVIKAAEESNVAVKSGLNPVKTATELEHIGDSLSDFGDASHQADAQRAYELSIKAKSGNLSMKDAIDARKLFDKMVHYAKSGNVPKSGELYKSYGDFLRNQINNAPIVGPAMNDYRFFIRAAKPLADTVTKEAATPAISKLQAALMGIAVASGNPAAVLPTVGDKILSSTRFATPIAQMFERGVQNPALPTLAAGTAAQYGANQ